MSGYATPKRAKWHAVPSLVQKIKKPGTADVPEPLKLTKKSVSNLTVSF
jgi:hypothetical protein